MQHGQPALRLALNVRLADMQGCDSCHGSSELHVVGMIAWTKANLPRSILERSLVLSLCATSSTSFPVTIANLHRDSQHGHHDQLVPHFVVPGDAASQCSRAFDSPKPRDVDAGRSCTRGYAVQSSTWRQELGSRFDQR